MSKLQEAAGIRTDFEVQQRFLRAAGAWAPNGGRLAYSCYCAFVTASLVAFVATQVSAMLHFWGDIISITTSSCVTFIYMLAIFKQLVLLKMRRSADKLLQELDACLKNYGRAFGQEKATIFGECARKGRLISRMQVYLGVSVCIAWLVLPILRVRKCSTVECRSQNGFPAIVWYPFSFTEAPVYQVTFVVVSTGLCYGSFVSTTVHGVFSALMLYVAAHLRFLNLMASHMCTTGQAGNAAASHKHRDTADGSEEFMRSCLRECVRYHIDIERLVQRLSELVGPILLGQFLSDMITISASAFVTKALRADLGLLLQYGSYVSGVIEQMLLICWCGNEVLEESERLQMSVYSCDWTGGSPRFRKELRIFLCRSGRPLLVTASKFYTITRETFLLLINASYSYFALLNQLNSE